MLAIIEFLSRISGAYIFSVPLLVAFFTIKSEFEKNSIILRILSGARSMSFLIAFFFMYAGELSIFYLFCMWIILIPVSIVIILMTNGETNLANFDIKLFIASIPRKVSILTGVLLMVACSFMLIDTVINRPVVIELHQNLMKEISESSDPKTVLLYQPMYIYDGLGIVQNIKQIEKGEPSVVNASPWKMEVSVRTTTQTENIHWRFQYIRLFGEWQFQGSNYKSIQSKL